MLNHRRDVDTNQLSPRAMFDPPHWLCMSLHWFGTTNENRGMPAGSKRVNGSTCA